MKILALRTVAVKAAASAFMILAFTFALTVASPPSWAQYTAGHALESKSSCHAQETPSLKGASGERITTPHANNACGGPIGPQWDDSTVIDGLNGAGTVRVNMLANLEALLNIGANCAEIIAVIWGLVLLYIAFQSWRAKSWYKIFTAALLIKFGLSIPECVNWMVATARDANLFS